MGWDRLFLQGLRRPRAGNGTIDFSDGKGTKLRQDCGGDNTRPQFFLIACPEVKTIALPGDGRLHLHSLFQGRTSSQLARLFPSVTGPGSPQVAHMRPLGMSLLPPLLERDRTGNTVQPKPGKSEPTGGARDLGAEWRDRSGNR